MSFAPSSTCNSVADLPNFKDHKREGMINLFMEYCANSSVHGVKYFGCRKRSIVEKAWWAIVFAVSLYGCGRLIFNVWNKWNTTPVIVSFAEKSTPVWQIPFPAVTICPETKATTGIFNFTEMYHQAMAGSLEDFPAEDLARLEAVAQVCDAHLLPNISSFKEHSDASCVDYLRNMSVSMEEMLFFCKWRNDVSLCNQWFKEIITEEGICYTFNTISADELLRKDRLHKDYDYSQTNETSKYWTLENGYTPEADLNPYPLRVLGAGARAGLFILLRLYEYDLDYICRGPVQGFKILLHSPGEYPQVSKQYFRVPLNQEVIVSVKPQMITTSAGLKDYTPERRQCYFNSERELKFFKVYTQQNCELECITNFTLAQCGCVKFSMPHDSQTAICGGANIQCYNDAEDELLALDIKEGLIESAENYRGKTQCNCLPACTSIQYDAEISQADFDWSHMLQAYRSPVDEFPGVQLARLTIFFKEAQFLTSKRSELYGTTDFLANCGGLLGLFMGVSLLSFVEILYYCTIRPLYIMKRQKKARNKTKLMPTLTINGKPEKDK